MPIFSKKRGEKDTGLLSGRSERESEETSAATEAIERRNAVARIANIDGRVAVVRKKHVSGIKVVANKETSRSKRKATGNKCGEQKPKFNWKVEGGKLDLAKCTASLVLGSHKRAIQSGCICPGVQEQNGREVLVQL